MTSRLSFIVLVACIYAGCLGLVDRNDFGAVNPFADGNFIEDFFGSETSEIVPTDERERAAALIKANHALPRFTFFSSNYSLERVSARFCAPLEDEFSTLSGSADDTWDLENCEWAEYAESLLLIAIAAFIIALIIFPFLFCGLILGRCCCCGTYRPTTDICCGDPDAFEATRDGYSNNCVLSLLILSIACVIVMAAGAGVGIWGSTVMTENVYEMANFTNKTAYKFAEIVDAVVHIIRSIDDMANISEVINEDTLVSAEGVGDNIRNVSSAIALYAGDIDTPRQVFMYVTLLLPIVLMILVIISRFCCWWMSYGMYFLGFILTALSLWTFGFLYPLSSGIADVCVFLDTALEDPDRDTFINSIFSCGEHSVLAGLGDMSKDIFETAGNVSCSVYSYLNELRLPCDHDGDGYITPTLPEQMCSVIQFHGSDECNFATYSNLSRRTNMTDRKIGCFCQTLPDSPVFKLQWECGAIHSLYNYSAAECPESLSGGEKCMPMYCESNTDVEVTMDYCYANCSDHDLAVNSGTILNYTLIAGEIFDVYNTMIKPYLNCESVVGITTHAKDFVCVNMMNSVTPMYIGEILGAAGSFVGTFIALLSTKRFRKRFRRKYAMLKEGSAGIEL